MSVALSSALLGAALIVLQGVSKLVKDIMLVRRGA